MDGMELGGIGGLVVALTQVMKRIFKWEGNKALAAALLLAFAAAILVELSQVYPIVDTAQHVLYTGFDWFLRGTGMYKLITVEQVPYIKDMNNESPPENPQKLPQLMNKENRYDE